jgi:hypothetical protein
VSYLYTYTGKKDSGRGEKRGGKVREECKEAIGE